MGPISKLMTGMFAVDATRGAGRGIKKEIRHPGNQHDAILGNRLVKAPAKGGVMNALNANPMYKRASDEIEEMYNRERLRQVSDYEDNRGLNPYVLPAGAVALALGANFIAANNLRDPNFVDNRIKNLEDSLIRKYTKKGRPIDNNKLEIVRDFVADRRKTYEAGHNIVAGSKRPVGELKYMAHRAKSGLMAGVDNFIYNIPRRIIRQDPVGREALDTIARSTKGVKTDPRTDHIFNKAKDSRKGLRDLLSQTPPGKATSEFLSKHPAIKKHGPNAVIAAVLAGAGYQGLSGLIEKRREKTASEMVKEAFDKKKALERVRSTGKKFVRSGTEGVVYFGTPALTGLAIGKNITNPIFDKIEDNSNRVVVEVPIGDVRARPINLEKQAFVGAAAKADLPWGRWAKEQLPQTALQGLSWAAVPAAITVGTGRNIKGRLEKIEGYESRLPPLADGRARVTIETPQNRVDEKEKTASDIHRSVQRKIRQVEIERRLRDQLRRKESLTNFQGLPQGIRNQRHMHRMHKGVGLDGYNV